MNQRTQYMLRSNKPSGTGKGERGGKGQISVYRDYFYNPSCFDSDLLVQISSAVREGFDRFYFDLQALIDILAATHLYLLFERERESVCVCKKTNK